MSVNMCTDNQANKFKSRQVEEKDLGESGVCENVYAKTRERRCILCF